MGFRVVDKSSFTFETDLPPSSRNIHPSGILHAFRSTLIPSSSQSSTANNNSTTTATTRSEHTFAWITNSLHIESTIKHLESHGFNRSENIVFIPYSTKTNWINTYPHASPALECNENGKVVVYLNYRPYPNGLGELGSSGGTTGDGGSGLGEGGATATATGEDDTKQPAKKEKKKRVYKSRAVNMLKDNTYMPDAERDELHIEIYNYLSWLHGKLEDIQNTNKNAASAAEVAAMIPPLEMNVEEEDVTEGGNVAIKSSEGGGTKRKSPTPNNGVELSELKAVVNKLELAFAIIPNAKAEIMKEANEEMNLKKEVDASSIGGGGGEGEKSDNATTGALGDASAAASGSIGKEGEEEQNINNKSEPPPFLEEALSPALKELVAARALSGKPCRRSKKRQRRSHSARLSGLNEDGTIKKPNGKRGHSRQPGDFEKMYEKLVAYKNEHGNCMVQKSYQDQQLANWVRGMREKYRSNERKGIREEVVPEGKQILAKTLTAERIQRLESIGFIWSVAGPKVSWEDRFNDCMQYYQTNKKWPSQQSGSLGEWVHKQRTKYAKGDKKYMETHAVKLDEVGFEWTPRGNTRMPWDEGFELLMAFGKLNGHFDVPSPGPDADKNSNERKLYNWVTSLHSMYKSYKTGRKSGSLTNERVVLLIKNGFVFRDE